MSQSAFARNHRAAGLHHRRRRNPPHPLDRSHASLHQSGRLLASGKLHRHRTAAALRRRGHGHQFRNERRHGTHARHRRTWRNARSERFERSGPRRPCAAVSRPPWWPSPCCSPCWSPTSPTSWCSWRTNTKATLATTTRCTEKPKRNAAPLAPTTVSSWRKASNKKTGLVHIAGQPGKPCRWLFSQQYGLSGIERSMNDTLKGQENSRAGLTW